MMERILGPFPDRMVRDSKKLKKYFRKRARRSESLGPSAGDSDLYRVDWDWDSADGRYVRENCKPLDRYNQMREDVHHNNLFHLLKVMLDYDPKRRITLEEALRHRFIEPQFNNFCERKRRERQLEEADKVFQKRNNFKEFHWGVLAHMRKRPDDTSFMQTTCHLCEQHRTSPSPRPTPT